MSKATIQYSDEEFEQKFREHWAWLAETGDWNKGSFAGFWIGTDYGRLDPSVRYAFSQRCFACGASMAKGKPCSLCPVIWGDGILHCCSDDSPFTAWRKAETAEDRKKFAAIIAKLQWIRR